MQRKQDIKTKLIRVNTAVITVPKNLLYTLVISSRVISKITKINSVFILMCFSDRN